MNKLIIYILVITGIISCNNEITQQLEPKGVALGKMNEIVVIADDKVWESAVGDTFRYYFSSAFPILPRPEPLFDLRHFTLEQLNGQPLRKELRSYVVLSDLSDGLSPTTEMVKRDMGSEKFNQALETGRPISSVGKDKWARGQVLVYLFGSSNEKLMESITKSFPATARRINQHDEKQLQASIYVDRINIGFTEFLKQFYNLDLQVPGDFVEALRDESEGIVWFRKDPNSAILNLVIRKIPYTSEKQFSKDSIIAYRNYFGKKYVDSDIQGNYMVINDQDLPVYDYTMDIDGHYAKEIRGTWEMTEDFSGGPFNTYLIHNKALNELIYIDVFVLAPGRSKRDMMMQLDHIVKSSKILKGDILN